MNEAARVVLLSAVWIVCADLYATIIHMNVSGYCIWLDRQVYLNFFVAARGMYNRIMPAIAGLGPRRIRYVLRNERDNK